MKKHFYRLFILLYLPLVIALNSAPAVPANALAEETQYGLIGENAVLLDEEFEPVTGLPATYFAVIKSESATHYAITYSDLSGFIEKSKLTKVDFEPKIKFGAAFFTAQNDTHPAIIRAQPTSASTSLGSIPDSQQAMYYGAVSGEALIPAAGSSWYYVKYGAIRGYVYSTQGIAQSFGINSGEKVESPAPDTTPNPPKSEGFSDWIYIVLLVVPSAIIMLALFGRARTRQEAKN